jgi:HD-like signal output (HDOD) protein
MPTQMHQLFDRIHKIPQIPEIVREIVNQLNDPNALILDIAKNVEKEQLISLRILRLVNSAHFGLSRKVGSINEATAMLGMNQLKTLVIASGIVSAMPAIDNFDIKQFWKNSFRTAAYAKWFAEQAKLEVDIAYAAGLFSSLGIVLIHMGLPSEANEIDQHVKAGSTSRAEIEINRLGYTSQAVCAELCRRWKFADELIDTIEQADEPMAGERRSKLACTVFLARFIGDSMTQEKTEEDIAAGFPFAVAAKIGLAEPFIKSKLAEILAIQSNLDGLLE